MLISLRDIERHYVLGDSTVHALAGVSLEIEEGDFVAVMGTSGSGKSTLMNLLGCLDQPTKGSYHLAGRDVSRLSKNQLAEIRNHEIGFVFQNFNLLARTSAQENVELPLIYQGLAAKVRHQRARDSLHSVGLAERVDHVPSQLSGGQQQRVAIARAIVTEPKLILADEPTGNLDSKTSVEIIALLQQLGRKGHTVVLVTHEADIAAHAQRVITVKDGLVASDVRQKPTVAA